MQGIEHVLAKAFIEGEAVGFSYGEGKLELFSPGLIEIPDGKLIATDPLVFPEREAFTQEVPKGSFPVFLSIVKYRTDQRVAFARVQFRPKSVAEWKMALIPGHDPAELKEDEFYGYGVDAGTGCFMSLEAGKHLEANMEEDEFYFSEIYDLMDDTYQNTWSWTNFRPGGEGTANVIIFTSGMGDGLYGSWFGFDDQGEIVCVVTDFSLFDPPGSDD